MAAKQTSSTSTVTPATQKGEEAAVRFAYTFSFLDQVNVMRAGMRFWIDLFAVHNLFTCDTDERRCRCKTFFNGRVWMDAFAGLDEDLDRLSELVEQGIAQPDVREFQTVTDSMIQSRTRYDGLNYRVTKWQARHAAKESAMLDERMCSECWSATYGCRKEAQEILFAENNDDDSNRPLTKVELRR
jgi:hypothetical protein